jgi:uncharacterized membrane protein YdjX (TVP38/TMEM64 family)
MNKNRFIRIAVTSAILVIAAGLVYFAFLEAMPELLPLLENGDVTEITRYLKSSDRLSGLVCTALLQAVQVVSVILPGAPIQIAAGIVYGTWRSFFVCHLSSVAANTLVFIAARKFGARMDKLRPIERKDSKLDFILKSDTPTYMTLVACLVPILPNGFIPYVAAKTKIKPFHYAIAVYCGSFFPVFVLCAAGNKILQGGYIMSAALLVGLCVVVFLLTKFRDPILKLIGIASAKLRRNSKEDINKNENGV